MSKKKGKLQTPVPGTPEEKEIRQLGKVMRSDYGIKDDRNMILTLLLGSPKNGWEVTVIIEHPDIRDVLTKANKSTIWQLVNMPVEVVSVGEKIKSWRILEEVL